MGNLWILLQVSVIITVGSALLIAISNIRFLQRLGDYPVPKRLPPVSILIPARNEETNIAPCVQSLLAQQYPDFEVIVLDDNSEDGTARILGQLASRDQRLRVLQGAPLPPGWEGKNWACHQLAQAAGSELLLFTDADTRHHPQALADAVAALLAQKADLLTAFPHQEVISWSEQLLVPTLTWSFIVFLPLRLAYQSPQPGLSITMGQYMLFRRKAYEQIGGHEAVRYEIAEDLALGRNIKARGLRWRLADGNNRLHCRMYRGFREVFQGYSKNLFPGFQYNVTVFVLSLLVVGLVALEPLAVLLLRLSGAPVSNLAAVLAAVAMGLTLLVGGISYPRFEFPSYLPFLYPLTAIVTIAVAACSLLLAFLGRYSWKGRRLSKPKLRWW